MYMLTRSAADVVLRRADLRAMGMFPKQITRAVRNGELIRVRRDHYLAISSPDVERAVRVGGRVTCVSLLAMLGVFVFDASKLHIHVDHSMSRLRSPDDHARSYGPRDRTSTVLHWWSTAAGPVAAGVVAVEDALAHAIRCQDARSAVATVDSVLHLGILSLADVRDVFARLPARFRVILDLADGSAEAGSETFMRLILRQLGLRYRTQVWIDGVGRVDFLVEGWLIVECDSKAHHEGWEKQRSDRRRDLAAAGRGLVTLRPLAEDLFHHRDEVLAAVRGIVRAHRGR